MAPLLGAGLLPATLAEAHWELGAETGAQESHGRAPRVTRNLVTTLSDAMDHHLLLTNENTETLRNDIIYPDRALSPGISQNI